jgi:hypothetical protein
MDAEEAVVRAYYERGEERDRLSDGRGQLEFIRTTATRIDGIIGKQIYLKYPAALDLIDEAERTGVFPPLHAGASSACSHRPDDLRAELTEAGLEVTDLVSVEGPGMILPDLDARMADPADRAAILDGARALERVPELIGFGPHLLATAILPATR